MSARDLNLIKIKKLKHISRVKAFSLIEIAIVLGILGILSAYAIPHYMSWSLDAKKARAKQDLATLAEQVAKYEIDQNLINIETFKPGETKKPIRLRSFNELKGKYMANIEKLRDPWGFEYLLLPEAGEKTSLELLGYKTLDGTMIKINAAIGEKMPPNLPPGSSMIYKKFVEDTTKKDRSLHPKIVYSRGPNGRDEKAKGDDIKHECRPFKYLHSVIEMKQN